VGGVTRPTVALPWIRARLGRRRVDALAIVVVGLLALGFFNPVFRVDATFSDVAGHQTVMFPWAAHPNGFTDVFPQSDQANAFHPWQVLINRSFDAGTLPYWNRHSFGGAPFLTNGAGGGLYPPKAVLSLLVSPSWVHDLFLLLHVFLSGVAMYLLLRELGARFLASMLAAVAWMFSSHTFGWLQLEYIAVVALALPASLLFVHRAFRLRSLASAFCAGLVLGVSSFNALSITLLVFPVVLGYALALGFRDIVRGYRRRDRRIMRFGIAAPIIAVAVTLGSASLVLVPTAFAAVEAGRGPMPYAELVRDWDVPIDAFRTVLRASSEPASGELLHELVFVGTPAALLALIGVLGRRPGAALGVVIAAVTFLVTVGTPATWLAYHGLPGFEHFRPLGRALFLWCFAISLLGGLGLDAVQRWSDRPSVALLARLRLARRGGRLEQWLRGRSHVLRISAAAVGVAAIAVTMLQLIPYAREINPPFQPRDEAFLYPETVAVRALYRDRDSRPPTEGHRLLPLRRDFGEVPWRVPVLWGGVATVLGLESVSGYESILPSRILTMNRVLAGEDPDHALDVEQYGAYIPSFFVGMTRFDLLSRFGVTTIYAPPDIADDPGWNPARLPFRLHRLYAGPEGRIFEIGGDQPRAYVVHRLERVDGARAALRRFADPDFDHRRSVILEPDQWRRTSNSPGPQASNPSVASIAAIGTNTESYDVQSARAGWLVVTAMWDPGWRATVDGEEAPVLRANYNLRAVPVPAGRSKVELEYSPRGLELGAGLTAVTLFAPLLLAVFNRARRRPRG
jgi:hypothetical protein